MADVKAVNPPDTNAALAPCAFIVASKVSPPGISVMRSASTRSMTDASSPASNPTRSCNAPSKSTSPFIARTVIAATRSPTPASVASSSMHSCWIMVESISASSRRFLRPSIGTTFRSTPIASIWSRVASSVSGRRSRSNSAAMPGFSQRATPPPHPLRSASTKERSTTGASGEEIRTTVCIAAVSYRERRTLPPRYLSRLSPIIGLARPLRGE